MIRKEMQAIIVVFIILASGLAYTVNQQRLLQEQVNDLQETTGVLVETLYHRINELENLIVECYVTIDNGTESTTHTVYLTKGATALDALRRVAVVQTQFYPGLGEYIVSINGLQENVDANKFWMWYIEENGVWVLAPVGAGSYELRDDDNIKFSYEVPSW